MTTEVQRVLLGTTGSPGGEDAVCRWLGQALCAHGIDATVWEPSGARPGPAFLRALYRGAAQHANVVHVHHRHLELALRLAHVEPEKRRFTLHHSPTRLARFPAACATSCPSEHLVQTLPAWRMTHIPSPVLSQWTRAEYGAGRVLYVGRIAADKDWRRWLDVLCAVAKDLPRVEGLVYGDGPDRDEMHRMARALLGDRVRFAGWRARSEILVRATDVLLLTSPSEADPLVVWEAAASSIPIVAPPVGDLPKYPNAWQLGETVENLAEAVAIAYRGKSDTLDTAKRLAETRNTERVMGLYLDWYTTDA